MLVYLARSHLQTEVSLVMVLALYISEVNCYPIISDVGLRGPCWGWVVRVGVGGGRGRGGPLLGKLLCFLQTTFQ